MSMGKITDDDFLALGFIQKVGVWLQGIVDWACVQILNAVER